jgi:hypothetical protein
VAIVFRKLLFVLVPAVVLVTSSAVIAARGDRFRVQRATTTETSAKALFAVASNPSAWERWSPWAPGTVKVTILDSRPPNRVTMRLEFVEPVRMVAFGTVELQSAANRPTAVTWTVEGRFGFVGKAWSLMASMDAVLGAKLDRGLGNLARLSELTRRW